MVQFKWKDMAMCCLFAAFKIEEKVMNMTSLLKWSHHIFAFLNNPKNRERLDVNGREFFEMKEKLQFNERILLQTIGFEMSIVSYACDGSEFLTCWCVKQVIDQRCRWIICSVCFWIDVIYYANGTGKYCSCGAPALFRTLCECLGRISINASEAISESFTLNNENYWTLRTFWGSRHLCVLRYAFSWHRVQAHSS